MRISDWSSDVCSSDLFTAKTDDHPTGDSGTGPITPPIIPPVPEPVLAEASIDPRALAAFQPDYHGALIRQGKEGQVVVRVTTGRHGRGLAQGRRQGVDAARKAAVGGRGGSDRVGV